MVRADDLERGREQSAAGAWASAHDALTRADSATPLRGEDLELLARSAYMLGRDDEYRSALERAYRAHLAAEDRPSAARCAWWVGHNFLFRGDSAAAGGWFARGRRVLDRHEGDCVERGYLLIPVLLQHVGGGAYDAAEATAANIAAIGERFGDDDLAAIGLMEQGHALVRQGRAEEGLSLVDETMVAVTAGELSPIVAGIVYCNTIAFCRDVYELRRAREWTEALTQWCAEQPEMIAHQGLCRVHRAEIMTLGGAWADAVAEARQVGERFREGVLNQRALAHAAYREGEVHRLQGGFQAAEEAYREATERGLEPQPGLALLRLAQGDHDSAAGAIRRAAAEATQPLQRAALLPAYVRITIACGDLDAAGAACRELEAIGERQGSDLLQAQAAQARGELDLAEGDAASALQALRRACEEWRELGAPHDAARARVLLALACRALGDDDTAAFELQAARAVFSHLGAAPDVAWVDGLGGDAPPSDTHGLTARELEVLRLVAAGKSNREIAAALVISEHTARRHLQNIFAKLDVSSRAAATALAIRRGLV
jgi:DNA-binding CsgD family transcriptional regulator